MTRFLFLFCLWAPFAVAQQITFIVPAGVGSASDVLARKIAQNLEAKIKQPIVIDNAPGGDQLIGLNKLAATNGPTLLLGGTTAHVFNPVFKKLDGIDSTVEVLDMVAHGPAVWYTNKTSGITNAADLVNKFKQNKTVNVGAEMLSVRINIDSLRKKYNANNISVIPYKSSSQTLVDVAAGNLDVGISIPTPGMIALANEGKIILLANTSKKPFMLDNKQIPPIANYSTANQFTSGWFLSTSKKHPVSPDVIIAVNQVLQDPELKQAINAAGVVYDYRSASDAKTYIKQYRNQLTELVNFIVVE